MPGNPLQQRESVAVRSFRTLALSPSGMLAALAVGAAALSAGLAWTALLVVFFVGATAVTSYRAAQKMVRAAGLLEKPGARDSTQVLANGGAFAAGAIGLVLTREPGWAAFAAGALAAASADTWATELGLLSRSVPRSIITWRPVLPGTSGGVTLAGTAAGVAGALVVSLTAGLLSLGASPAAVATGGIAGMLIDSVLGAAIQERRWCPSCEIATERRTHSCGATTSRIGGLSGMGNDAVNAVATVAGGTVAAALLRAAG